MKPLRAAFNSNGNAHNPSKQCRILVVDDHDQARQSMTDILRCTGYGVDCCASVSEALNRLLHHAYDVIITDLRMPGLSGLDFMQAIRERKIEAQVLMVTAFASVSTAVEAMRHGAFDYIEKPFTAEQLEQLVARALQNASLDTQPTFVPAGGSSEICTAMIGISPAMSMLRARIAQVAPTQETVLISGESGTGKELVARHLHALSTRSHQPLVSLNCPVLSAQLLESELFGHERGSFTGADASRVGRFELADNGTILLDEVSEIDLGVQAKLLRVLQERSFERVGSSSTMRVDVRVLATTNRDLRKEVGEGRFRNDLYFRLAVVPLAVPALRSRIEDVPLLTDHFLQQAAQRLGKPVCQPTRGAIDLLTHYHWPGNVRELQNLITRASVLATGETIDADELRPWLIDAPQNVASPSPSDNSLSIDSELSDQKLVGLSLEAMEQKLITATLAHFDGHRARTAEALGIGIRTLTNKLRDYGFAPRAKSLNPAA